MAHILAVIIVVLSIIALVFASHFFLYFSLIHFFKIVDPGLNMALIIVLSILAISFLVSSLMAHWRENIATRMFYLMSGIWLGFTVNLVIALIIGWIIRAIFIFAHLPINSILIGCLAFVAAIIYSVWGVYNAFHPRIRNINIKIANLPDSWRNKKAVHVSDLHLGHVYRKNFLEKIVLMINSVEPEIVFVTGDLFDGMDGQRLDAHVEPLNQIASKQGTFFVTGNHETYFGTARALGIMAQTKIRVLSDEVVEVDGLRVVGVSYAENFSERDVAQVVRDKIGNAPKQPTVLLYHSPEQINEIKESGLVDLQLAGHTHFGQMFPFNYITRLIFCGYDYGLHTDGNYSLYTTNGVGAWGPSMRTGSRPEVVVINFL